MVLDDEAVTLPYLRHRRRSAELGLLDRPARDADEMVVMAGLAGDEAPTVETADAAVRLEQRERPVDGRKADGPPDSRAAVQSSSAVKACCCFETSSVSSVRWRVFLIRQAY